MHNLEVVDGTGGGKYSQGTVVPISAVAPFPGATFLYWSGDGAMYIANVGLSPTTLTMPASATWIASTWRLTDGSIYTGRVHF